MPCSAATHASSNRTSYASGGLKADTAAHPATDSRNTAAAATANWRTAATTANRGSPAAAFDWCTAAAAANGGAAAAADAAASKQRRA